MKQAESALHGGGWSSALTGLSPHLSGACEATEAQRGSDTSLP